MTPILTLTVIATAALSANRAVTLAGAVPAAGALCIGITRSDAAIGQAVPVDVVGTTKAVSGAAFAADVALMADATGKLITHTGTNKVVARSMAAATAADQVIDVLLIPSV